MFKPVLLSVLSLTAALSAAQADTIIISQGPGYDAEHPETLNLHGAPAYDRMTAMCEAFGVNCTIPGYETPAYGVFSPEAQADAQKRLAIRLEEVEEYADDWSELYGDEWAEEWEELAELLPAPVFPRTFPHVAPGRLPHAFPPSLFGYPRAEVLPYPHGSLFGYGPRPRLHSVVPHVDQPRITVPDVFPHFGYSPFAGPRTNPFGTRLHAFPRVPGHTGAFPRGGFFSWPSL